jgi:iron complex outermembrane recepter protein
MAKSSNFFAGTALAAFILLNPAQVSAQETVPQDDNVGSVPIDGIVVTAQRRSERLIDVPISIAAFTSDTIEKAGVTAIDDLTRLTPGVVINRTGAYQQPTVRGIGTSVAGAGQESNVALYLDGVYLPSQTGNVFDVAGVERIEVLKGPQGTLFGRNATGGAILVITRTPQAEPSINASVSYGRFNDLRMQAYATGGISDALAGDISVSYRQTDGFVRDIRTGALAAKQDNLDIRTKLLLKPAETISLLATYARTETNDPTGLAQATLNGNSRGNILPGSGPTASRRGDLSMNFQTVTRFGINLFSLRADVELGELELKSISAYRTENGRVTADLDSSYGNRSSADYDQYFDNFSQEITLGGTTGGLSWVAGGHLFSGNSGHDNFVFSGFPYRKVKFTTEALAGFVDGTYKLGSVSLIAGLRYSTEKKHLISGVPGSPSDIDTDARFSAWTPRLGISLALSDQSNIYATWTRGFKSGTYNELEESIDAVAPENVDAFEVGYKRGGPVQASLAGFYYRYRNIQVTAYDYNVGLSRLFNAAAAEIWGAEADVLVKPIKGLEVRGTLAYTHANYTDFPGATGFVSRTDPITGLPDGTGNLSVVFDGSSTQMIRAPRFTASASIEYIYPTDIGNLRISFRPYYTSSVRYTFNGRNTQPSYFTLDGNISLEVNDHFTVGIWGRNLTDTEYANFRFATGNRDGINWANPASYGVSLSTKF